MVPQERPDDIRDLMLDPAVMGPPIVWLASDVSWGVHNERIVATEFDQWRAAR
jgi:gluconate 5-dehydrogenase